MNEIKTAYVVFTDERTENPNDGCAFVHGVFLNLKDAQAVMEKLKEIAKKEFPRLYVDYENGTQIVFREKNEDCETEDYVYRIEMKKTEISA